MRDIFRGALNMKISRYPALTAALLVVSAIGAGASSDRPVPLNERAAGAARVVVATAVDIEARFDTNASGDQLIVSRVRLQVHETLKGEPGDAWVDVEGGTVDGITFRVSDLPEIHRGDRAVFFLERATGGVHTPHRRGLGILPLDEQNVVRGSSLDLEEIRRVARGLSR
jgi:hypothetical protein